MPTLQLYIYKSADGRKMLTDINGDSETESLVPDVSAVVDMVEYNPGEKTVFYIVSPAVKGSFIHIIRTIPPLRSRYLDAVVYISYDTDIMSDELAKILLLVTEKIKAHALTQEDLDELSDAFARDFDTLDKSPKVRLASDGEVAYLNYDDDDPDAIAEIFSTPLFKKPWIDCRNVILIDRSLKVRPDSAVELVDEDSEPIHSYIFTLPMTTPDGQSEIEFEIHSARRIRKSPVAGYKISGNAAEGPDKINRLKRCAGNLRDSLIWGVCGLIAGILLMALTGCGMMEYHPYSTDLSGNTDINSKTVELLESKNITLPFKFAFITDTQGSLDEMIEALDIISNRGDIEFIIHGGDITDFGLPKEFVWTRDILDSYAMPYLAVIGNHDCLGNGEDSFDFIFGEENFSMNIDKVHFVFLNTVSLEYDYSKPVPDLDFIDTDRLAVEDLNLSKPDSITHTIIVMHSRPYDEQFNNNVAKPFNHYISRYPGMNDPSVKQSISNLEDTYLKCHRGLCINGHNHSTSISDIFDNGIFYYQCANMGKRTFFIFTITHEGYDCEVVEF